MKIEITLFVLTNFAFIYGVFIGYQIKRKDAKNKETHLEFTCDTAKVRCEIKQLAKEVTEAANQMEGLNKLFADDSIQAKINRLKELNKSIKN